MKSPQSRHVQVYWEKWCNVFFTKSQSLSWRKIAICPRVDNYWSKMLRFFKYWDLKFHDPEVLLLVDEIMRRYRMGKDINIEVLSETFPP
jgi:hypothetical protein